VVDLLWVDTIGSTALDHFQYTYDVMGKRLTCDKVLPSAFDEAYEYNASTNYSTSCVVPTRGCGPQAGFSLQIGRTKSA
jgi:hypothetical protein